MDPGSWVTNGVLFTRTTGIPGGRPVVFIHTDFAHARMWDPLAETLGAERTFTVAYDCRCFGASTNDLDGEYSDLSDLASVLAAFGSGPAVLVGSSRGARIAVDFALARPELVAGLFLVPPVLSGLDVNFTAAERELEDAIEAADGSGDVETPYLLPPPRPAAQWLAELVCPVRVVVGEADTTGSLTAQEDRRIQLPARE